MTKVEIIKEYNAYNLGESVEYFINSDYVESINSIMNENLLEEIDVEEIKSLIKEDLKRTEENENTLKEMQKLFTEILEGREKKHNKTEPKLEPGDICEIIDSEDTTLFYFNFYNKKNEPMFVMYKELIGNCNEGDIFDNFKLIKCANPKTKISLRKGEQVYYILLNDERIFLANISSVNGKIIKTYFPDLKEDDIIQIGEL
jgi:hypothetical protein